MTYLLVDPHNVMDDVQKHLESQGDEVERASDRLSGIITLCEMMREQRTLTGLVTEWFMVAPKSSLWDTYNRHGDPEVRLVSPLIEVMAQVAPQANIYICTQWPDLVPADVLARYESLTISKNSIRV